MSTIFLLTVNFFNPLDTFTLFVGCEGLRLRSCMVRKGYLSLNRVSLTGSVTTTTRTYPVTNPPRCHWSSRTVTYWRPSRAYSSSDRSSPPPTASHTPNVCVLFQCLQNGVIVLHQIFSCYQGGCATYRTSLRNRACRTVLKIFVHWGIFVAAHYSTLGLYSVTKV